jgi:hypothetical protein
MSLDDERRLEEERLERSDKAWSDLSRLQGLMEEAVVQRDGRQQHRIATWLQAVEASRDVTETPDAWSAHLAANPALKAQILEGRADQ